MNNDDHVNLIKDSPVLWLINWLAGKYSKEDLIVNYELLEIELDKYLKRKDKSKDK